MKPLKTGFGILKIIERTVIIPIREVNIEEVLKWLIDIHKSKKS